MESGELVLVEVDDVDAPGAADLDGARAERLEDRDLDNRVGVDLVAETGEFPTGLVGHGVLSFGLEVRGGAATGLQSGSGLRPT